MADKGDLVVELWDRDIISASDSLGAFTFPLADWLKKCYIEQKSIKPFKLIHDKQNGADQSLALTSTEAGRTLQELELESQVRESVIVAGHWLPVWLVGLLVGCA